MGKNKNISKSGKPQITETDLLKSLNELEEAVLKGGDELLDQDPEGGLSTEGEPLSKKAPKGKTGNTEVAKSDDDSSDNGDDDDDVNKGGDDDSDDGSEDDASEDDASEDEDASGGDDESEPSMPMKKGKKMGKSLRDRADEDETMSKAIEVSDFIEALVEQNSQALDDLSKSFSEELGGVNDRLSKSEAYQRNFNGRLAAGLINMGKVMSEQLGLIKSMINQPNPQMRKSVLSNAEISEPHRRGDDDSNSLNPGKVAEWLMEKAMAEEISPLLVTQFEVHQNIEALPADVRKSLINDLRK